LKVLEYTAAEKNVISSHLREIKQLGLPNVSFARYKDTETWIRSIKRMREKRFPPNARELIKKYDWPTIIENSLIPTISRK